MTHAPAHAPSEPPFDARTPTGDAPELRASHSWGAASKVAYREACRDRDRPRHLLAHLLPALDALQAKTPDEAAPQRRHCDTVLRDHMRRAYARCWTVALLRTAIWILGLAAALVAVGLILCS